MRKCICKNCSRTFYEDDTNPNIHYSNPATVCTHCSTKETPNHESDSMWEMSEKEQLDCCKRVLKQIHSACYSELLELENSDTADQYVTMLMACIKDVRRHTKKAMKKLKIDIN